MNAIMKEFGNEKEQLDPFQNVILSLLKYEPDFALLHLEKLKIISSEEIE